MTKRQFWSYCQKAIAHRTSEEVWLTYGPKMGIAANKHRPVFLIWEDGQVVVCRCRGGKERNLYKPGSRTLFDSTGVDAILLFEDLTGCDVSSDMGLDFLLLASESNE